MPKYGCSDCWYKIEEFHNFHRNILTAQEEYLKREIKLEVEYDADDGTKPPKFIEVITNFDGFTDDNRQKIKCEDSDIDEANASFEDDFDAMEEIAVNDCDSDDFDEEEIDDGDDEEEEQETVDTDSDGDDIKKRSSNLIHYFQ